MTNSSTERLRGLPLALKGIAAIFRSALRFEDGKGRAEVRSLPRPDTRALVKPTASFLDASLARFAQLDKQAQTVPLDVATLCSLAAAMLDAAGFAERLRRSNILDLTPVTLSFELAFQTTIEAVGDEIVPLVGRLADTVIQLHEAYEEQFHPAHQERSIDGLTGSWVLRPASSGVPDIWQQLQYLDSDTDTATIELTWMELDTVRVQSTTREGTIEQWSRSALEHEGTQVGWRFRSPVLRPDQGRIERTLDVRTDRSDARYQIWLDLGTSSPGSAPTAGEDDPPPDEPILVPTPVPDPEPSPTPTWLPPDFVAAGVDPADVEPLFDDLMAFVLDVAAEFQTLLELARDLGSVGPQAEPEMMAAAVELIATQ